MAEAGQKIEIPCAKPQEVVDPTGCGDAFRAGLLYGLAAGLERVRASTIAREGSWVLFYVRFFRLVWNTNLLVPIDSGAINAELDGDVVKVAYRLNTLRLCLMMTAVAVGGMVVALSGGLDPRGQWGSAWWHGCGCLVPTTWSRWCAFVGS